MANRQSRVELDAKAFSVNTPYLMPFSATVQPRPAYPGPVIMQIPEAQLVNVSLDGTTAGGGGLVDGLDHVWTS